MNINEESLKLHYELGGKIEVVSRKKINTKDDLSLLYTPGVAEACREIYKDYDKSFALTRRNNLVAVITDGTAVLGLGDIGPAAAMPVMEGKCALFKEFADVDAFPICLDTKDIDEIVRTVYLISKSFGGINLEDIAAPRCFEIERRLKEICDIPVFHDDQHGTAVAVCAALINAFKITNRKKGDSKIVICGAGAAGTSIANLIMKMGFGTVIMVDRNGILYDGDNSLTDAQKEMARVTNPEKIKGTLADALESADVFIGVSAPHIVTTEMISKMNKDAIVFPMANPVPEIEPEDAIAGGAKVIGTGRSDLPNQINNVLVFPGIFKGALRARAKAITEDMKVAAAKAIASLVTEKELENGTIIPSAFNERVADAVAQAVEECV